MKSLITLSLLTTLLVSCGHSAQELEAIKNLESRKTSLEFELRNLEMEKDHWLEVFNTETNIDTKYAFGLEYQKTQLELDEVKKELSDITFQLAQF